MCPQCSLLADLISEKRLQVPDKHSERVPCLESRSTENVRATDTHNYKVFALYALLKGGKRPLTKQEAAGFYTTNN